MTVLYALFGSRLRVRLLRALLLTDKAYSLEELETFLQTDKAHIRKELRMLIKSSFVKDKEMSVIIPPKKAGGKETKKQVVKYALTADFPYRESLRALLMEDESIKPETLTKIIKPLGKWALAAFTGIFTGDYRSDVDVLLVGVPASKTKLDKAMRQIEAEVGTEVRYTVLEPSEFEYRYQMFDKFVRDVFDGTHVRTIDTKYRKL